MIGALNVPCSRHPALAERSCTVGAPAASTAGCLYGPYTLHVCLSCLGEGHNPTWDPAQCMFATLPHGPSTLNVYLPCLSDDRTHSRPKTMHVCPPSLSHGRFGWLMVRISSATPPRIQARLKVVLVKGFYWTKVCRQ